MLLLAVLVTIFGSSAFNKFGFGFGGSVDLDVRWSCALGPCCGLSVVVCLTASIQF